MTGIADVIAEAKEFGIFEFYLPFIIMFALFYGVLNVVNIFGKETTGKRINVILAGAMSLFVMVYTPVGVSLSVFLAGIFGETLVVIVSILAIFLVAGVVLPFIGGVKTEGEGDTQKRTLTRAGYIALILIALVGLSVFISSNGAAFFPGLTFGEVPSVTTPSVLLPGLPSVSSQDLGIIALGLGTIIVMFWLTRSKGAPQTTSSS